MLRYLFSLDRVNLWVLLGGAGLNLLIALSSSLVSAYFALAGDERGPLQPLLPPLMLLGVFLACGLAGWIIAKISEDVPLRHAFLAALGAAVPYTYFGLTWLNPWLLILGLVAVAGNVNGALLVLRNRRTRGG